MFLTKLPKLQKKPLRIILPSHCRMHRPTSPLSIASCVLFPCPGIWGRTKMKTLSKDAFSINRDTVDLRYVEQLMDSEQTTALSYCLLYAESHLINGKAHSSGGGREI